MAPAPRSRPTTSTASTPACARSSPSRQPFVRDELSADAARAVFAGHRYKLEIIDDASTDPMSATESGLVRTYENPPAKPKDVPPFAGYPGSSTSAGARTCPPPTASSATSS